MKAHGVIFVIDSTQLLKRSKAEFELSDELASSIGDALATVKDPIVLLNKVDLIDGTFRGETTTILVNNRSIKATFV